MVIVLFGVSGAGKTTVGRLLAQELGWKFFDADEFHSSSNLTKMHQGIPLTDEDRRPWLGRVNALVKQCIERNDRAVVACSALKAAFRQHWVGDPEIKLVYLKGEYELLERRLKKRHGHFMNPKLLQSQFDALEPPQSDALVIEVNDSAGKIVEKIRAALQI